MDRGDGLTSGGPAAEDDVAELRRRVLGYALPGGTFVVPDHERYLLHDAMQSPPLPDGVLHPAWALLASLRDKGVTTEELVALVGASEHDGVLGGEVTLDQVEPLRARVEYTVSGEVTGLRRREGRRGGVMDLLTFELQICEPAGRTCATVTQTLVILRNGGTRES